MQNWTGKTGLDWQNKTARTDCQKKTAGIGLPGQDCQHRIARTWLPGQD
jgi:hypothetical protein